MKILSRIKEAFNRNNNVETFKIPVSWLHKQAYCEQQIYIENMLGIRVETEEMIEGSLIHEQLYLEHLSKATEVMTVEEALKKSKKEKVIIVFRELPVMNDVMIGVIDEIKISPFGIVIIDDKPNRYPFFSNKKQVWGYCTVFEDQYHPKRPIMACIRHRDTQKIVWLKPFTKQDREIVLDGVKRIQGILNGTWIPQPTMKKNKCKACPLRLHCERRLV